MSHTDILSVPPSTGHSLHGSGPHNQTIAHRQQTIDTLASKRDVSVPAGTLDRLKAIHTEFLILTRAAMQPVSCCNACEWGIAEQLARYAAHRPAAVRSLVSAGVLTADPATGGRLTGTPAMIRRYVRELSDRFGRTLATLDRQLNGLIDPPHAAATTNRAV